MDDSKRIQLPPAPSQLLAFARCMQISVAQVTRYGHVVGVLGPEGPDRGKDGIT